MKADNGAMVASVSITLMAEARATGVTATAEVECMSWLMTPDQVTHDVEEFLFTNPAGSIIQNDPGFGSETGTAYPFNGWRKSENKSHPVHYVKGNNLNVSISHMVAAPWSEPTPIFSYGVSGSMSVPQPFVGGAGYSIAWLEQPGTALDDYLLKSYGTTDVLWDRIQKFQYQPEWSGWAEAPFDTVPNSASGSGSGIVYVIWGLPLNEEKVTHTRLDWAVATANGTETKKDAAYKIYDDLGNRTNKSIFARLAYGDEWYLLDGVVNGQTVLGDCDDWATLMKRTMNLLGIEASAYGIHASNDNIVDVLQGWTDPNSGEIIYLLMDFNRREQVVNPQPANYYNWNAYEGVCQSSGHVWALFPKLEGCNSFPDPEGCDNWKFYNKLGFTQFWVRTNKKPGVGFDWVVMDVLLYELKVPLPR